jgi:DNA ligase-1
LHIYKNIYAHHHMSNSVIVVKGRGGEAKYEITRGRDGEWWCSCPSWRFGNSYRGTRTCKHMVEHEVGAVSWPAPRRRTRRSAAVEPPARMRIAEWREPGRWEGMLVSEKMDGVGLSWDGARLLTRTGRVVSGLPGQERLPPGVPLDLECWAGRGNFSLAVRAVNRGHRPAGLHLVAFDVADPGAGGFRRRYTRLVRLAREHGFEYAEQFEATTAESVEEYYAKVCGEGAEGIVLRAPDGLYKPDGGTSADATKLKGRWDGVAIAVQELAAGRWMLAYGAHTFAVKIPQELRDAMDAGDSVRFVSATHPNGLPYRPYVVSA